MCSQIATASPDLTRRKPGTVGTALQGVGLRLGEDGEILTRGETRALGYVGGGGGSHVGASSLTDADGWYHTGDLGRIDDDGDLWVTGRRADRIVSGGVTIDAVEVEEALRSHPGVVDACVVGVPDPTWGERVAAWVEPVVGEFDLEEVETHVRAMLSAPKMPRLWHVEGDMPRNAAGKLDRAKVRDVLGAQ
jgi:acyl-CoA synthetase (AMP-forming)/AMP-acid ligase II